KLPWKTLSSGKLNAVITPHSVEVIPFSAADGTLPIEMHRFLVSSGAGVHVVAVPIAIQPDGSATPAGPPTFEPYLTTEQPVTVDLYARFPEATLSPQAQSQIRTWAQAYFGNNLQGLQEATGQAQ